MAGFILFIVYVGIADGFSNKHGFWSSFVWPYHVGVLLGDQVKRRSE